MKIFKFSIAAIIAISLVFTSCEEMNFCIHGEGDIVTETIDVADFSSIKLLGADDVVISYGDTLEVTATGHPNIIDRLKTDVSGNNWNIRLETGCHTNYELTVYITMPDVEEISILGSGDVYVNDFVNGGDLELNISGSGDIELNKMEGCPKIDAGITGSGDIRLEGETPDLEILDIRITGSGNFEAYPAITSEAFISILGSGDCYVSTNDYLDVHISGSGDVYYKGTPEVDLKVTGSGNVISRN